MIINALDFQVKACKNHIKLKINNVIKKIKPNDYKEMIIDANKQSCDNLPIFHKFTLNYKNKPILVLVNCYPNQFRQIIDTLTYVWFDYLLYDIMPDDTFKLN